MPHAKSTVKIVSKLRSSEALAALVCWSPHARHVGAISAPAIAAARRRGPCAMRSGASRVAPVGVAPKAGIAARAEPKYRSDAVANAPASRDRLFTMGAVTPNAIAASTANRPPTTIGLRARIRLMPEGLVPLLASREQLLELA